MALRTIRELPPALQVESNRPVIGTVTINPTLVTSSVYLHGSDPELLKLVKVEVKGIGIVITIPPDVDVGDLTAIVTLAVPGEPARMWVKAAADLQLSEPLPVS